MATTVCSIGPVKKKQAGKQTPVGNALTYATANLSCQQYLGTLVSLAELLSMEYSYF